MGHDSWDVRWTAGADGDRRRGLDMVWACGRVGTRVSTTILLSPRRRLKGEIGTRESGLMRAYRTVYNIN